ncbi:MAG: protein-tyrosine phosphatase family protein [Planctomycetota bacterium]|jgi:protein-tyrosine phosphatase
MREIVRQVLWIGNAMDARDTGGLADRGIAALVDLAAEEPSARPTRELVYCRFPLIDGAGNPREVLDLAVRATAGLIRSGIPTIVCCGAGMSRSPAIAAVALAVVRGNTPDHSLEQIVSGFPHDVSPPLWDDVLKVYDHWLKLG